ncbi:type IV conjugative transfer system protein TraL [Enterobacter asburiae]
MSGDELKKFLFPKTLGEQMRVFGMPLDEFIPSVPPFLIAIWEKHALGGLIYGALAWLFVHWLKRGKGSMWLYNLLYWYLPTELFRVVYRKIPGSCFRQWIK